MALPAAVIGGLILATILAWWLCFRAAARRRRATGFTPAQANLPYFTTPKPYGPPPGPPPHHQQTYPNQSMYAGQGYEPEYAQGGAQYGGATPGNGGAGGNIYEVRTHGVSRRFGRLTMHLLASVRTSTGLHTGKCSLKRTINLLTPSDRRTRRRVMNLSLVVSGLSRRIGSTKDNATSWT